MADVSVNSVKPSEIGPEAIAYYLTVSILGGAEYGKGYSANGVGVPVMSGFSEKEVLETYARCLKVVRNPYKAAEDTRGP